MTDNQCVQFTYVTRSNKKGIKSLGPIQATGKEVKDNHHVLHLTPTLQLALTVLSFEILAWLKYQIKLHFRYFLTVLIIIWTFRMDWAYPWLLVKVLAVLLWFLSVLVVSWHLWREAALARHYPHWKPPLSEDYYPRWRPPSLKTTALSEIATLSEQSWNNCYG